MASILAVDDSISMRQMLNITLAGDGHDVVTAEDGPTALKVTREQSFDLVITDFQMPNMDGISLIRELRRLPAFRNTPLLMLTTECAEDKKQAGREAGATGWVVKPIEASQLLPLIRRLLVENSGSAG